jgi:hypothetical protein
MPIGHDLAPCLRDGADLFIDFPSRGRTLIGRYIKFEEVQERIVEGLRLAGLPLD